VIRGRTAEKKLALVFTGGDYGEGGSHVRFVLAARKVRANFFFTGGFLRRKEFQDLVRGLVRDGHYVGPHSDGHLLYCDWDDRSKTLVSRERFAADLLANYEELERFGVRRESARFFMPPYEWFNRDIVRWAGELGVVVVNFTPGASSNADYATPDMAGYLSSREIYERILAYEKHDPDGLNGFILLLHIGTAEERTDKFYLMLGPLIDELRARGYGFVRIDKLLRAAK
jgi:peptidoglycan/xylan/chitin deacetylase (PgdA/CDA1 family)